MKKTFLFIAVLFVVVSAKETNETGKMFYNYRLDKIFYYQDITDETACMLIPQNPIALDTYKWYRNVKKYEPEKAVRLTVKYWTLNLVLNKKAPLITTEGLSNTRMAPINSVPAQLAN